MRTSWVRCDPSKPKRLLEAFRSLRKGDSEHLDAEADTCLAHSWHMLGPCWALLESEATLVFAELTGFKGALPATFRLPLSGSAVEWAEEFRSLCEDLGWGTYRM